MSVYHQTIVIDGWEIGWDQYKEYDRDFENQLESELGWRNKSVGDVAVVADGMGGDYCYFGVVVAATNSTRDGPQHLEPTRLEKPEYQKKLKRNEVREELDIDVGAGGPSFHVFTHVV